MNPDHAEDRMTDPLSILLDKQAITEVLATYCRAFDRLDDALSRTIWHEDGACDYSNRAGAAPVLFRDYIGGSTAARRGFATHSHQIANTLIRVVGVRAASEAYFTATVQMRPMDGVITQYCYRGRYLDRWSKREGRWAIDHRQVVFDSCTPYDFPAEHLAGVALELTRRDGEDPSYALFASLP
jgi:hypothetical protein